MCGLPGKLISENSNAVFPDRVGTNRASGARFHPYGDEITSTSNDRQKFATYTRDGYTGLDYADQRFYASSYGRFNTPDPDGGSANPSKPGSWNRFAYVSGDPVNLRDGRGLEEDDCSQDYEEDGEIDEGCCLPTAWWSGGEQNYACSTGGGPSGGGDGGGGPPVCTFTIYERGLDALGGIVVGGAAHTYIAETDTSLPGQIEYFEGQRSQYTTPQGTSDLLQGYYGYTKGPLGAYPSDNPASNTPEGTLSGSQYCGLTATLANDVSKINSANIAYGLLGPNSNSVLRYFIQSLPVPPSGIWYQLATLANLIGFPTSLPGLN